MNYKKVYYTTESLESVVEKLFDYELKEGEYKKSQYIPNGIRLAVIRLQDKVRITLHRRPERNNEITFRQVDKKIKTLLEEDKYYISI